MIDWGLSWRTRKPVSAPSNAQGVAKRFRSAKLNEIADAIINGLLVPLQSLLNRTELHLPTTVSATVQLKPKEQRGITVAFDKSVISSRLVVASLSHIIDGHFVVVVAQIGGSANAVPVKPKNVKFQDFRTEVNQKLVATGADWMRRGHFAAYVDRGLIRQLAAQMLSSGPLCMNGKMKDLSIHVDTRLRLPPVEKIDCTPTRDCSDKRECAQRQDCAQHAECNRCLVSVFGHCKVRGNDPGCELGKEHRRLQCEAQKPLLKAKCEADKDAANKLCELKKTADKGACESYKEGYKRWRAAGPNFGNIETTRDLLFNGTARACITNIALDDKDLKLKATLTAESSAHVDGKIKFIPLN